MSFTSGSSNHTGGISETAVMLDLLKYGFNVLFPVVPTRYDRVVELTDGTFKRVQIKTGRIDARDGNLRVTFDVPYNPKQIDYFAVYSPIHDKVFYIPVEEVDPNAKGFTIRLTPRKNKRITSSFTSTEYEKFPLAI